MNIGEFVSPAGDANLLNAQPHGRYFEVWGIYLNGAPAHRWILLISVLRAKVQCLSQMTHLPGK